MNDYYGSEYIKDESKPKEDKKETTDNVCMETPKVLSRTKKK